MHVYFSLNNSIISLKALSGDINPVPTIKKANAIIAATIVSDILSQRRCTKNTSSKRRKNVISEKTALVFNPTNKLMMKRNNASDKTTTSIIFKTLSFLPPVIKFLGSIFESSKNFDISSGLPSKSFHLIFPLIPPYSIN